MMSNLNLMMARRAKARAKYSCMANVRAMQKYDGYKRGLAET